MGNNQTKRTVQWVSQDHCHEIFFYVDECAWNEIKKGFKQVYGMYPVKDTQNLLRIQKITTDRVYIQR